MKRECTQIDFNSPFAVWGSRMVRRLGVIRALWQHRPGAVLVGAIVAFNVALVLHLTGLSYGRSEWLAFNDSFLRAQTPGPTATPTLTPTPTPTRTPTATPTLFAQGASCLDGSECASSFCADRVCCNQACDQPGQHCNVRGREGTCVAVALAPILSGWWLSAAVLVLLAIGALTIGSFRGREDTAS